MSARRTWGAVLAAGLAGWLVADPAASPRVAELQSDLAAVRAGAAAALGRSAPDPAALPALITALRDPEPAVRREVARALGQWRTPQATGPLLTALRDPDRNVRFYAAYALGEIRDPKAVGELLATLRRDTDWNVRDQVAWALRELRSPEIVAPLAADLRLEAADVPHVAWLLKQADATRVADAVTPLLADGEVRTRARAVEILAALAGPDATEGLIRALTDADLGVRRRAAQALATAAGDPVTQALQAQARRETDADLRQLLANAVRERLRDARLAAHWSFDDRDTSVAHDVSGNGVDGQIKGCVTAAGKAGAALRFGPGKFVELGRPAGLPMEGGPFTVMAWILAEAPTGVVVARGGAFCGFSLYLKEGRPRFGIRRQKDDPLYVAAAPTAAGGGWTHLAGVVQEGRLELYVNGTAVATTPIPGFITSGAGQGMEIGVDEGNSPAEICDSFVGLIDEVKVFGVALSREDIVKQAGLPAGGKP